MREAERLGPLIFKLAARQVLLELIKGRGRSLMLSELFLCSASSVLSGTIASYFSFPGRRVPRGAGCGRLDHLASLASSVTVAGKVILARTEPHACLKLQGTQKSYVWREVLLEKPN